jgi:hypothetical protein
MDLEEIKRLYREHFSEIQKEHKKYKYPCDSDCLFESFLYQNKVNDNTVTEDMMEWFAYHVCDKTGYFNPHSDFCYCPNLNSYVNEMLNKTSLDLLLKSLNTGLSGTDRTHFVTNETDYDDKVNTLLVSPELYDIKKISKICDKMMWSFTAVEVDEPGKFMNPRMVDTPYLNNKYGYPVIRIKVEPIKTKNITDFVKNKCGGKIYHICTRENLKWILQSGLRVKGEKNDYRYIQNKVYFFCGENKDDLLDNFVEVANSLNALQEEYDWIKDEYALLEIDVNGYNIDFYMDGYYLDQKPYIGYTYNYFHPRRIREVDNDELNWI